VAKNHLPQWAARTVGGAGVPYRTNHEQHLLEKYL